jgi:hypothetical protein
VVTASTRLLNEVAPGGGRPSCSQCLRSPSWTRPSAHREHCDSPRHHASWPWRTKGARNHLKRALMTCESRLGADHPDLGPALAVVDQVKGGQGRLEEPVVGRHRPPSPQLDASGPPLIAPRSSPPTELAGTGCNQLGRPAVLNRCQASRRLPSGPRLHRGAGRTAARKLHTRPCLAQQTGRHRTPWGQPARGPQARPTAPWPSSAASAALPHAT